MSKRGQDIIAVIDQRIDSYIKESKITVRYIGQIIEVLGNNRYKVQLIGYDTVYTFPARPYVDAIVNDYVYIESKAGNIDNGIIIDKINGTYGYIYNANGSEDMDLNSQGAMLKSIYDKDNNGIVDNASRVNNHTVQSDVPANARFTDTTDASGIRMANGQTVEQAINSISAFVGNGDTIDEGFYRTTT